MSVDTIKIGVIGAGKSTVSRHIPRFQSMCGVEVFGVVNRSLESSQRVASRFGIPRVYGDWSLLVCDSEIDAVFIGTWPYMHRTLVMEALKNDKHVLTQARMANSAAEASEMLRVSLSKPHLVTQVYPSNLMNPDVMRKVVSLVQDGSLGQIMSADFSSNYGFTDSDSLFTWRNDRRVSGFNTLLLGVRYENLMRILGPAASISAVTRVFKPVLSDVSLGRRVTTIPDHVEVLAELVSGGVLHMNLSRVCGFASPATLWVFGSKGTLKCILEPSAEIWCGYKGNKELSLVEISCDSDEVDQPEKEFINAIRGGAKIVKTTFEDGLKYMEFTEAVIRSSEEGRTISLPLHVA